MATTSRGKYLHSESGSASDWPAVMFSAASSIALDSTLLPVESLDTFSAFRIGMPLCNKVPKMRAKRDNANDRYSVPTFGMRRRTASSVKRPESVCDHQ